MGIECSGLAYSENNRSILVDREVGSAIDDHLVSARRKSYEIIASAIIRDGGPLGAGACIGHRDSCTLDR